MLMTFLPVPLLLHRGQLGNQSLLPSLRLRSRLLVSPPPLPPERLLTAHTAPMGAEHPLLPARIRPTGWKPLQGALRRSPTVLCCPRAPHPSPPPDFRAQRQLTEGAHSRDQDVPRWGRDPRPCITPMWGNTPHPCLSFPPSTATHRAQCCFGLQERHRRHPQSRTRAWLWGEPAMGGDWHPGGGPASLLCLPGPGAEVPADGRPSLTSLQFAWSSGLCLRAAARCKSLRGGGSVFVFPYDQI